MFKFFVIRGGKSRDTNPLHLYSWLIVFLTYISCIFILLATIIERRLRFREDARMDGQGCRTACPTLYKRFVINDSSSHQIGTLNRVSAVIFVFVMCCVAVERFMCVRLFLLQHG